MPDMPRGRVSKEHTKTVQEQNCFIMLVRFLVYVDMMFIVFSSEEEFISLVYTVSLKHFSFAFSLY